MSHCAIKWCAKNSRSSNYNTDGITFHRFPREPNLKKQWVDATKRKNWCPGIYSVVCSRHFSQDSFKLLKNGRRKLIETAIPTLLLPMLADKKETSSCSCSDSQTFCKTPPDTILSATVVRNEKTESLPLRFPSALQKRMCKKIIALTNRLGEKNKQVKCLHSKVMYYKKQVESLKIIIKELEAKNYT